MPNQPNQANQKREDSKQAPGKSGQKMGPSSEKDPKHTTTAKTGSDKR